MNLAKAVILGLTCIVFNSCNKKISSVLLDSSTSIDEIAIIASDEREYCNCTDPHNYAPDPKWPQFDYRQYIRVNVHFPNTSDKSKNLTGVEALNYAKNLISASNNYVKKNKKMNLPKGNDTPVYDTNYRLTLVKDTNTPSGSAIYEDIDDEDWYYIKKGKGQNNYNKNIIKKHAKNDDEVLNIFAMVYPPDSLDSETFSAGQAGIALGTSVKIADPTSRKPWQIATLLNHEVGHVFGLRHSWYKNDGCDDTPPNPNCWDKNSGPRCIDENSNNMMDYNNQQKAITPCQIGVIRKNMLQESSKTRKLLEKNWCDFDPTQTLVIRENTSFERYIDNRGDIIVEEDVELKLSCRLHMPKDGRIIVKPGGKLILNSVRIHNDCGEKWDGIILQSNSKKKATIEYLGRVQLEDLYDEIDT